MFKGATVKGFIDDIATEKYCKYSRRSWDWICNERDFTLFLLKQEPHQLKQKKRHLSVLILHVVVVLCTGCGLQQKCMQVQNRAVN